MSYRFLLHKLFLLPFRPIRNWLKNSLTESQTDKHPDNLEFNSINMEPRSQVRCNALGLKIKIFLDFENINSYLYCLLYCNCICTLTRCKIYSASDNTAFASNDTGDVDARKERTSSGRLRFRTWSIIDHNYNHRTSRISTKFRCNSVKHWLETTDQKQDQNLKWDFVLVKK